MDERDFNVYGDTLSDSVVVTATDYEKGTMSAPENRNMKASINGLCTDHEN